MSVSDSTSGVNLKDVLSGSSRKVVTTNDGVATATRNVTGSSSKNALGKDAFLQLLVTQMKNQNPLDPQDNGEFVAQLAQFSSLEGIQTLNSSVNAIAGSYKSSQALQASSLVGRSVIAQTDKAVVDTTKSFSGTVAVPGSITGGTVTIKDKDGHVVKTLELAPQSAGKATFVWDGKKADGTAADPGTYTFSASTTLDNKTVSLATYLPATVNSVTLSQTGGEMLLNLAGLGSIALSKVQTIGL